MHSKIFQLSTEPISKEEYIGTENIENGEIVSIDYAYETRDEERKELIATLVNEVLPEGMFTISPDEESLTYNGSFPQWCKDYLRLLQTKTAEITTANVMEWIGPAFQLQKAIVNPLMTDILFVTDFAACYALAERSREFMTMVNRMHKGDKLYVGAILGYHF